MTTKQAKAGHTKTPWTINKYSTIDKWIEIPEAGVRVDYDDVDHREQAANAEHICRAVNCFDDLLESHNNLLQLVEILAEQLGIATIIDNAKGLSHLGHCGLVQAARDAKAKAESSQP